MNYSLNLDKISGESRFRALCKSSETLDDEVSTERSTDLASSSPNSSNQEVKFELQKSYSEEKPQNKLLSLANICKGIRLRTSGSEKLAKKPILKARAASKFHPCPEAYSLSRNVRNKSAPYCKTVDGLETK